MSGLLFAVLGWLAAVNLAGGLLFALDKRAAVAGWRRVPERVLLAAAALGASPAILAATPVLRHKTRKQPFRTLLLLVAAAQAVAAIGLLLWWAGVL